jgi:hypothetical protein
MVFYKKGGMFLGIVDNVRSVFSKEAKMSPMLLSDLANMEQYIAESYQSRSIIELLQNADDACAKKFSIIVGNDYIVVANDGRIFNENDVMSICRSGVSTKKRDGKTIGYRGIGFKSVVNLAERVHVISGEIKMTFSRELTKDFLEIDEKVPLIRIPHTYNPISNYNVIIDKLIDEKFSSIFIFEKPKLSSLNDNLSSLDSSILLFLKNISEFEVHSSIFKKMSVCRAEVANKEVVVIKNENEQERWLVKRDEKCNAIAFLLNEYNEIIKLDESRAVIHSFMPTKESVGLPVKINGDFSTDPSRTKIIYDEISEQALNSCSELIVEILKEHISGKEKCKGLDYFNILSDFKEDRLRGFTMNIKIQERFFECMRNQIAKVEWYNENSTSNLRVNPKWLNSFDFKELCKLLGYSPLDKDLEKEYPGILKFASVFGVDTLELNQVLELLTDKKPTIQGSVDVICEFIRLYRFNCNSKIRVTIKNVNLMHFKTYIRKASLQIDDLVLDSNFYECLKRNINDINDLKWFIKLYFEDKETDLLSINKQLFENEQEREKNLSLNTLLKQEINNVNRTIVPPVNKWRSVEQNLAAFLQGDMSVKKVIDVSKSNLGYDIEVHYKDDRIRYIEVKSVEKLGATIALTNNEYSTANELKENYLLAIVEQTDYHMEVCFIENPINHLNLTKRITRWEWICDDYKGEILNYSF